MAINNARFVKGQKFDWNRRGGKCPACNASDKPKGGVLRERSSSFGKFLGCNRFPDCKFKTNSYR